MVKDDDLEATPSWAWLHCLVVCGVAVDLSRCISLVVGLLSRRKVGVANFDGW